MSDGIRRSTGALLKQLLPVASDGIAAAVAGSE